MELMDGRTRAGLDQPQGHTQVVKEKSRLGTRWSQETVRHDFVATISNHNLWLGKFLKLDKSQRDRDSQESAVVDVHIRFSLSQPKILVDAVLNLASHWFKLLKRTQPLLPILLQNCGGGTEMATSSVVLAMVVMIIRERAKSPGVGASRTGSLFSRGVSTERWRRSKQFISSKTAKVVAQCA